MSSGLSKLVLSGNSIDDFLDFILGLRIKDNKVILVDKKSHQFVIQTPSRQYIAQLKINALNRVDVIVDSRMQPFVHRLLVNYYLAALHHIFDLLDIEVLEEKVCGSTQILKVDIPEDRIPLLEAIIDKLPFVGAKGISALREVLEEVPLTRERRESLWRR